jgi:glyoxylase-like metal-dependent hydrolase (beta-lactamase superfamily II)
MEAAAASPQGGQSPMQVQVLTASPEGFLVNASLVTGRRDAVLIDAAFTRADAQRIVDTIRASGKNLTTVYITHDHPDHYFGLEMIKQAFPRARFVALPATVASIEGRWKEEVEKWTPLYHDAITSDPILPAALEGRSIELEDGVLEIEGPVQGDSEFNAFVWIPPLRTVIAGDVVYSGVYAWTAETDTAARRRWAATLDRLAALDPAVVVPGHQNPALGTTPKSLAFTKEYLAAFDEELANSRTPEQLQEKVKARYPDLALDVILKIGAEAALTRK